MPRKPKALPFRDKLVLNRWLVSLFGVEAIGNSTLDGRAVRPFQAFTDLLKDETEGLGPDGRHRFYERLRLGNSLFTWTDGGCRVTRDDLLRYEERIAAHTIAINAKRDDEPIKWKYFQWLELLFTEIYLDRYFRNRHELLADLNEFVGEFNKHWGGKGYAPVPPYEEEDLNKVCIQIATGGGKTLLMHVNLLQFRQYEKEASGDKLDFAYLVTPNERLSGQHLGEFSKSGIFASRFALDGPAFGAIQVLEISKLAETTGPETIATDAVGNRNLLLVDEAHAGISGKNAKADDSAWQRRRTAICEKGFAFEYSATFDKAVHGTDHEDDYAKSILFDYSYRWFYADGFGKDYRIFNIPDKGTHPDIRFRYLTGMLLSYYQQLRLWETGDTFRKTFNLAKPLWVFVGGSVSSSREKGAFAGEEKDVATDIAEIVRFVADFLGKPNEACETIAALIWKTGADTGLLTKNGDLFADAFPELKASFPGTVDAAAGAIHSDILRRVFHGQSGHVILERVPGDCGEIILRAQGSDAREPFGLINISKTNELCNHLASIANLAGKLDFAPESTFSEPQFSSIRESISPVNLLIGAKKFEAGWDCWRVGTLGLMHVGKKEGSQIIQLFGRGVRLKGWDGRLKRSSHSGVPPSLVPRNLHVMETLGVFGLDAGYMAVFREELEKEGLPGNERPNRITMPLTVTYDFGRRLKILRPKKKNDPDDQEYDFKRDGRVPRVDGNVPDGLVRNPVVADWYPRIQSIESKVRNLSATEKHEAIIPADLLALLDWDHAYFALECFKRNRSWHNLDLSPEGLKAALERAVAPGTKGRSWYKLCLPSRWLREPYSTDMLRTVQAIAEDLLKRYVERLYNESKAAFYEPRLELRDVTDADLMLPPVDESGNRLYSFSIEGATEAEVTQMAEDIQKLQEELKTKRDQRVQIGNIWAIRTQRHLFEPLFLRQKGRISIQPVCLNDSEFQFVKDLCEWTQEHESELGGREVYLLRNVSTNKGIGFFEAANFHPDFLLWIVDGEKQRLVFVEPHGLVHEDPDSPKILFFKTVKEIERRLGDPDVELDSYIVTPTPINELKWGKISEQALADRHIFFLYSDSGADAYIPQLLAVARRDASAAMSKPPVPEESAGGFLEAAEPPALYDGRRVGR